MAVSVTINAIGYRAGCTNRGSLTLRYADAGDRPMSNTEFCHATAA
jgi:hypothetical protein